MYKSPLFYLQLQCEQKVYMEPVVSKTDKGNVRLAAFDFKTSRNCSAVESEITSGENAFILSTLQTF